jgi:hypothetical protein
MWTIIKRNPKYSINEQGQVRNNRTERVQKHQMSKDGYYTVTLGYGKTVNLHRVLAEAFLEAPKEGQTEVAHNDGCRTNNNLSNLRWATRTENQRDRFLHNTHLKGERNHCAAFTNQEAEEIRERLRIEKISNVALAKELAVSHETVRCIRLNLTYA